MTRPTSAPTSRPRCAQSAVVITAPSKCPAFSAWQRPSLLDAEAEALVDAKLISTAARRPVTPKAQRRVTWNLASPEDAMACLKTAPLPIALDSNATSPVRRPSKAWPIMGVEESDTGSSGGGRQAEEKEVEEEGEVEEEEERPLRPRGARAVWPTPAHAVPPQHTQQHTPASMAAAEGEGVRAARPSGRGDQGRGDPYHAYSGVSYHAYSGVNSGEYRTIDEARDRKSVV